MTKRCFKGSSYFAYKVNIQSASDILLKRRDTQALLVPMNIDDIQDGFQTHILDVILSGQKKGGSSNG